jgi:hypothetical protein
VMFLNSLTDMLLLQCFFPPELIKSISTPTFILNSDYDSWQVISIFKFFSTCQKVKTPDCCFSSDTKRSCSEWILSWTGMVQLQSRYSEL